MSRDLNNINDNKRRNKSNGVLYISIKSDQKGNISHYSIGNKYYQEFTGVKVSIPNYSKTNTLKEKWYKDGNLVTKFPAYNMTKKYKSINIEKFGYNDFNTFFNISKQFSFRDRKNEEEKEILAINKNNFTKDSGKTNVMFEIVKIIADQNYDIESETPLVLKSSIGYLSTNEKYTGAKIIYDKKLKETFIEWVLEDNSIMTTSFEDFNEDTVEYISNKIGVKLYESIMNVISKLFFQVSGSKEKLLFLSVDTAI